VNVYGYEISAVPNTSPHQCVNCMKGNPGDGPFFRFPNRHPHVGDLWFCADCQSLVLHAWRLMPLARYEEQVAELKATVERELGRCRRRFSASVRTHEVALNRKPRTGVGRMSPGQRTRACLSPQVVYNLWIVAPNTAIRASAQATTGMPRVQDTAGAISRT
jgi:hypothetical protein